jgi:hypothetical protein
VKFWNNGCGWSKIVIGAIGSYSHFVFFFSNR